MNRAEAVRAARRRRPVSPPCCSRCGEALQSIQARRYDPFWIVLLMCAAAALSFFLIGAPVMIAALWLWSCRQPQWLCPACDAAFAAAPRT